MKRFYNYHFQGQSENEKILKIVRRHWFNILVQYLPIVFLTMFLLGSAVWLSIYTELDAMFLTFFESIFAIAIWIASFIIWINFYFDVWIITDRRLVNIEQKDLFIRHISELKFSKIQDVSTEVDGFFPTMLNYGEVYIQTAGTKGRFLMRQIPNPYNLRGLIMHLQSRFVRKERRNNVAEESGISGEPFSNKIK